MYTYLNNKKPNWPKKLKSITEAKELYTKAVVHGIVNENHAREAYKKNSTFEVEQLGLIILPELPWAGFSPDGLVWASKTLIEIKCPLQGAEKPISDVLPSLKYVEKVENGRYRLKKKHNYYGQVQWGLAILNFNICDFIIYSSYDNSYHVIKVPYDEEFANDLFGRLELFYFDVMLPFLYETLSSSETKGC